MSGTWFAVKHERTLIQHAVFLCYTFRMKSRTYEADREGKIRIYPALFSPAGVRRGMLKTLVEKVFGRRDGRKQQREGTRKG